VGGRALFPCRDEVNSLCPCGGGGGEGEDLWKGWALKITQNSQNTLQNKEYRIQKTPAAKLVYIKLPMYQLFKWQGIK
jgi:hypothetical protein